MVLAIGVAYMLLTRNWLNAASPAEVGAPKARRTLRDLIRDYRLAGRERRLQVQARLAVDRQHPGRTATAHPPGRVVGLERVRNSEVVKVGSTGEGGRATCCCWTSSPLRRTWTGAAPS